MSTILTASGRYFPIMEPEGFEFTPEDIAHALAHICRFTGHTREFYSVAQHCVYVASLLPNRLKLSGLLHDGAEAFIGDMSTPLKRLTPEYKRIEHRIEAAMLKQFGLPFPLDPMVKQADGVALLTERRDLMPVPLKDNSVQWPDFTTDPNHIVIPWRPDVARRRWLGDFYKFQRAGFK